MGIKNKKNDYTMQQLPIYFQQKLSLWWTNFFFFLCIKRISESVQSNDVDSQTNGQIDRQIGMQTNKPASQPASQPSFIKYPSNPNKTKQTNKNTEARWEEERGGSLSDR